MSLRQKASGVDALDSIAVGSGSVRSVPEGDVILKMSGVAGSDADSGADAGAGTGASKGEGFAADPGSGADSPARFSTSSGSGSAGGTGFEAGMSPGSSTGIRPSLTAALCGASCPSIGAVAEMQQHMRIRRRRNEVKRAKRRRIQAQSKRRAGLPYSTRVTAAFALTAAMTAIIMGSILFIVWIGQFETYTRDNLERVASAVAAGVGQQYAADGYFSEQTLSHVQNISEMSGGLAAQVLDASGEVVYDDTAELAEASGVSLDSAQMPASDQLVVVPIIASGEDVGTLVVWAFGSSTLLTQYDTQFKYDSYRVMLFAAALAIVIAWIIGFIYAKNLVNPVKKVTEAAEHLKEGDLSARTGLVGDDEISQLGSTFDAMADSIEKDRKLERRLTTDVAHELRTPLMAIQATVEAIRDGALPADEIRLSTIDSETRRLSRLVDALLKLSRLESGSMQFEIKRLDLSELIRGLVDSQQALFDSADMVLEFKCDPHIMVEGDADKLRQATLNLISNAVRYSDADVHVCVEVRYEGEHEASISVTDCGIGIAQENIKHLFSRFWRADEARERARGGLGVGLAVVNEIVKRHNGHIGVESILGQGTTFTIVIPAEQAENKGKDERHKQKTPRDPENRARQGRKKRQRSELSHNANGGAGVGGTHGSSRQRSHAARLQRRRRPKR